MPNKDKDLIMKWNKPSKASESDAPQKETGTYILHMHMHF